MRQSVFLFAVLGLALTLPVRAQAPPPREGVGVLRPVEARPPSQVVGLGERLIAVCEPGMENGRSGMRLTAYRLIGDEFILTGRGFHAPRAEGR